ncbi:aminoacyl tRNA synthase complex-interacting multifunctional protein 1-like isoform X2 [Cheilinus undulatus]|nr:aminoacyl tRNA synthase complex-interacting multifunctional protein 1-like isoform X2 [Cheilinus undulatus]
MGRGNELSEFQRGTIVGCHMSKKSTREISRLLDLPQSTVSTVIRKWKNGGITTALPRSGRPQKLKEEDRQVLEKVALENRLPSVESITTEFQTASGVIVSTRTVRRELSEMGFRGRTSSYNKTEGGKKAVKRPAVSIQDEAKVDVSRLDLRVGRVVSALQLPDTDSLYVLPVDVGEASCRTVVSELGKHTTVEEMQNRMVVLLCNLQPAMIRGVLSQAQIMCAKSPDKVELLDPPSGALPGDKVVFKAFPGEADEELKPKQKVWEQVQADLRTDDQCVATYKGAAFEVTDKGVCRVQTMSNAEIK